MTISPSSQPKPSPGFFNAMKRSQFKLKFRKFIIYNFDGDTTKAAQFYRTTATAITRLMYGEIPPTKQMIDDVRASTEAV